MARVLLIEDSDESAFLVKKCLEPLHSVDTARSIREAKDLMSNTPVDFILLDISLPDGSGLEFLKEIDGHFDHKPPIILLSAKDTQADIVFGLNSGADDYITKPFEGPELKARVEACLRRVTEHEARDQVNPLHIPSDLKIDVEFQRVHLIQHGVAEDINLTPLEFRIFYYLVQNPNRPLTRFRIAKNVWKDRAHFEPKGIDSHISHLRKKLKHHGESIKTIVGLGYACRFSDSSKSLS